MPYNYTSTLWPTKHDHYFRDKNLQPLKQSGPHCVSTVLAILTGVSPDQFQGSVNTQDPVSWSDAIRPFGMKLAYCPTDIRKVKFYVPELRQLNDLFAVCYYKHKDNDPTQILADPADNGWVCGSHIVLFHCDAVLDPAAGTRLPIETFPDGEYHTKRMFRVVPSDHARGL